MGTWLPWLFLLFVAILVMAMPWRHPHPNHEFILQILRLLEDGDANIAGESQPNGLRRNNDAKHCPGPPDTSSITRA